MNRRSVLARRAAVLLALVLPAAAVLGVPNSHAQFGRRPGLPGDLPGLPPAGLPGGPPDRPGPPVDLPDVQLPFPAKKVGDAFGRKSNSPTQHVFRCGKCGRELGRSDFALDRPSFAACPFCGVKFINGGAGVDRPGSTFEPAAGVPPTAGAAGRASAPPELPGLPGMPAPAPRLPDSGPAAAPGGAPPQLPRPPDPESIPPLPKGGHRPGAGPAVPEPPATPTAAVPAATAAPRSGISWVAVTFAGGCFMLLVGLVGGAVFVCHRARADTAPGGPAPAGAGAAEKRTISSGKVANSGRG